MFCCGGFIIIGREELITFRVQSDGMENQGATVVITHHILDGKQAAYEAWLNEIGTVCT